MTQVSNQTQLLAALAAQDSAIQVTSDFSITSQINILYPVTIESPAAADPFMLTKDSSYFTYLFRIQNGGALIAENEAAHGAGIYFVASSTGACLAITENASIKQNTASLNGGGCNIQEMGGLPLFLSKMLQLRATLPV